MEFSHNAQAHGAQDNLNMNKHEKFNRYGQMDVDRHNSNKLMKFASAEEEIKIQADDYQQQRSFRDHGVKKAVDPRIRLIQEGGNNQKNKDLSTNSQSANHSPRRGFAFNNPNKNKNDSDDKQQQQQQRASANNKDDFIEEINEEFASNSVRSLVENNNSSSSSSAYLPLHQLSSLGSSQNSVQNYNQRLQALRNNQEPPSFFKKPVAEEHPEQQQQQLLQQPNQPQLIQQQEPYHDDEPKLLQPPADLQQEQQQQQQVPNNQIIKQGSVRDPQLIKLSAQQEVEMKNPSVQVQGSADKLCDGCSGEVRSMRINASKTQGKKPKGWIFIDN